MDIAKIHDGHDSQRAVRMRHDIDSRHRSCEREGRGYMRYDKCVICSCKLLDEHGRPLNTAGAENQVDVCESCQRDCQWREVAIRFLHHDHDQRVAFNRSNDVDWDASQQVVDDEAKRLFLELGGILPSKLPVPPVYKFRHGPGSKVFHAQESDEVLGSVDCPGE